jgi:hypothetical protein
MLSFDSLDVFGEYTKSIFVHNGLKYRLSEYSQSVHMVWGQGEW